MLVGWAVLEKRVTCSSGAGKEVIWFPCTERTLGGLGDWQLWQLGQWGLGVTLTQSTPTQWICGHQYPLELRVLTLPFAKARVSTFICSLLGLQAAWLWLFHEGSIAGDTHTCKHKLSGVVLLYSQSEKARGASPLLGFSPVEREKDV